MVLGDGVGLFKIESLLYEDDFENLKNWVIQLEKMAGLVPAKVEACDRSLDFLVPGGGCTLWFKQKLQTRVAIAYEVICPTPKTQISGIQPPDINNFWMVSDPAHYTGVLSSYDKLHGYYASTGGGAAVTANLTTRRRRYPREVDGKPIEHLALTDKDGKPSYLITPDKVMTAQLVTCEDVIQYIVDGKLIYQIVRGDRIQVEGRESGGKPAMRETDAYMFGLTYAEGADANDSDANSRTVFVDGKVVLDSLSKVYLCATKTEGAFDVLLQGQPVINAIGVPVS